MTYQELKNSVEKNNMIFFNNGNYNLNFIWVRNDLIADNHFTDDLFVAYKDNGVEQVLNIKCTTIPGLKGSLYNPRTVAGATGTAVIKKGQYRGSWEFRDTYSEFSNYPYFRQIKPISYYRDGNKDNIIDLVQEQNNKLFGTHWHKMSNFGDKRKIEQFEINNYSLGCMGAPISEWNKVITVTRKAISIGQPKIFTGTILDKTDL
jgi:hypothetical protein